MVTDYKQELTHESNILGFITNKVIYLTVVHISHHLHGRYDRSHGCQGACGIIFAFLCVSISVLMKNECLYVCYHIIITAADTASCMLIASSLPLSHNALLLSQLAHMLCLLTGHLSVKWLSGSLIICMTSTCE